MAVQPGLCGTSSETPKTGFLKTRLICSDVLNNAAFTENRKENVIYSHILNRILHLQSDFFLCNLLNSLRKNDEILDKASYIVVYLNSCDKLNDTWALM